MMNLSVMLSVAMVVSVVTGLPIDEVLEGVTEAYENISIERDEV